jgi:hypothetical protein
MIAAVFPADEPVRTITLELRVDPPTLDEDDEEENEEPCDDDEICPPPDDTCETPPSGVPEIDADLLSTGLLLLVGGALVLASRRAL